METKFTPIAMRCNQEQFDAIKPKLDGKIKIAKDVMNWFGSPSSYLTNNYDGEEEVKFTLSKSKNRKEYETWDEATFLRACGIEVEETFTITKEQILKLNSYNNYDCGVALKEWFPSVFEVKPTEMTVAEIEQKLGCKIKIVG